MDVVAEFLHVGELGIEEDGAVGRTGLHAAAAGTNGPAVVEVDVLEAVRGQAGLLHAVGCSAHALVINTVAVAIPGIPAERRGQGELVNAPDDNELPDRFALGVLDMHRHRLGKRRLERSGNQTRLGIDGEPIRQPFD